MRAIIVGAVESTRVALQALAAAPDWQVDALITLPRTLAARHSDFVDLEPFAAAAGARMIEAADSNAPNVVAAVREAAPDMVFVIGWSQICKAPFLDAASGNVIGYHPAPLPQLRGRAVIPWTILLGHTITASTLFWVDGGLDSGPILAQRFLHVAPDETAATLYDRHILALRDLLDENLPKIATGRAPRTPQDDRYASWAARRTAEDGRIDWRRGAEDIWRLIRAVGKPYPGAFTHTSVGKLVLWQADLWDCSRHPGALPGQVLLRTEHGFGVCCGDGRGIWVSDWQSESGRPPALHRILGQGGVR